MVRIKQQLDGLTYMTSFLGVMLAYLYLDPSTQVLLPLAALLGIWSDCRNRYLIGRHGATVLSIAIFVFYAIQIERSNLVSPVINTLVLLLAIRLLTEKEGRHYLQIFMLASFCLAGSTLFTLTLVFLPVLVALLSCLICGLVLLAFYSSDSNIRINRRQYRLLARTTFLLPVGSLLLMLLFFLILPRTEHAMWDFLNPGSKTVSALAEQVSPGAFAASAGDDTVVFRAEMAEIPPTSLYWRTLVLDKIVGTTWVADTTGSSGRPEVRGGVGVDQNILPMRFASRYITALDTPQSISGLRYQWTDDGSARTYRLYKKPRRYQVTSRIGGLYSSEPDDPQRLLAIPDQLAPRARDLTGTLIRDAMTNVEKIAALENFFQQQRLTYATDDLPTGGDPVDTFLFDEKRGYCEYFASAFAVMLRQAGVPSRLVGGYLGGEFNTFAGYYAVSEKMAHVWVEAWLADRGWQRLDPSRFAINAESTLLAARTGRSFGIRQLADSIDYLWNQTIITFDLKRQFSALRGLRDQVRSLRKQDYDLKPLAGPAAILTLLIGSGLIFFRRHSIGPEQALFRKFMVIVSKKYGIDNLPPSATLNDVSRACTSKHCRRFVDVYAAAIYNDRTLTRDEMSELKRLIRLIRAD